MDNDNKRDMSLEAALEDLTHLYNTLNFTCETTNKVLNFDNIVKQQYCLHCRPVKSPSLFGEREDGYKSTIRTKGSDTYPSFVCSKCGEEFETKDLDLTAFLKESGEIVARISNLLDTYKLLVSAIPTEKILNSHVDDIKKIIFLHALADEVYSKCENLVERITKGIPDPRGPVNHLYNNCKKVSSPKLDFTGL